MDDEGQESSGFSGYAWYEFGRMSAESARQTSELLQSLAGQGPVPVDAYNRAVLIAEDWRAECQRLQQVNANLQAQLTAASAHVAELKAWGSNWKNVAEERRQQTLMMGARADRFEDEVERLRGNT